MQSAATLAAAFPGLPVFPVEADFTKPVDLLRSMRRTLGAQDAGGTMLLIGMDRLKDEATLLTAYDDPAGVTAAFTLTLIDRINRELDGDIPRAACAHVAQWNDPLGRIEMHLNACRDVRFTVASHDFAMRAGYRRPARG